MSSESYLFDTGALIDLYHGRARVRPYFDKVFDDSIVTYISPISEAELWLGLRPDEMERHEALLAFFMPLPLVSEAARLAGQWMRRYEPRGLGWIDALITVTATLIEAPILTRDRRLASVLEHEAGFIVNA